MSEMPEMNLFPLFEAMADLRRGTMDERDYFAQFDAELDEPPSGGVLPVNQVYFVGGDSGNEIMITRDIAEPIDFGPIWYCGKWYTNREAYQRARKENGEING